MEIITIDKRWFCAVVLVIVGCSYLPEVSKKYIMKGVSVEQSKILLPHTEMSAIPLGESSYNLTYEMSDMGVICDLAPKPVSYSSVNGLYLVDPGSSKQPEPSLQRFTSEGKRLYKSSLKIELRLHNVPSFLPVNIFVGNNGQAGLLASTSYNAKLDQRDSFIICLFDSKGNLQNVINMPEFKPAYPIFISNEGYLWAYSRKANSVYWAVYNPKGELEKQIATSNIAVLLPNNKLLTLIGEKKATLFESNGKSFETRVEGTITPGGVIVRGSGWFFGILTFSDNLFQQKGTEENEKQPMSIDIFYFHQDLNTLFLLGHQPLPSNVFDSKKDIPQYFEYFDPEMMSFDSEGNLYLIGRYGPRDPRIQIFRMAMNPEVSNEILNKTSGKKD
jgi:hypothetical protein